MGLSDDLSDASVSVRGQRKAKQALDRRMPVGAGLKGSEGFVTVEVDEKADGGEWDWILDHHRSVSRETHEIDETYPVEIGSWQMCAAGQEPVDLFRYKAKVRARRPGERLTEAHVQDMIRMVRKRRALSAGAAGAAGADDLGTGRWLVFCMSDLQLGKGDYGGTGPTVERVIRSIAELAAECKRLGKLGDLAGVVIADLGDITEGTSCFYDSQTYTIDLNMTAQIDLATELMLAAVEAVLPYAPRVVVGAVPSNHGEFRVGKGQVATDRARDNADLVMANSLARILAANPDRYGTVSVWAPPLEYGDPYVLTVDLDGVMLAFTHGHQFNGVGGSRMVGAERWWQAQGWSDRKRGKREVLPTAADADILVFAHGHHFLTSEATGKLAVQCPAAESGSEYFATATGRRSSSGVLMFEVSDRWQMLANNWRIV